MGIIAWYIGPQMIGAVFLLVGWIQKTFPPKTINNLYGYRMPSAMKNQQTWDEANRYSAVYMIKGGAVLLIGGLLITLLLTRITMAADTYSVINLLLILAATMGSVVAMMMATERHLEKTFDEK